MVGTKGFAVVLWVTGDAIGVSSVVAAMLGPFHTRYASLNQHACHFGFCSRAVGHW